MLEFPDLESELHRKLKAKGLVVLGMSDADTPRAVTLFIKQSGITFPVLLGTGIMSTRYTLGAAISPYPIDVIVDKKGRIAYMSSRYDLGAMKAVIDRELAKK